MSDPDDYDPPARRNFINCCDGFCGATDCYLCRGSGAVPADEEDQKEEE